VIQLKKQKKIFGKLSKKKNEDEIEKLWLVFYLIYRMHHLNSFFQGDDKGAAEGGAQAELTNA